MTGFLRRWAPHNKIVWQEARDTGTPPFSSSETVGDGVARCPKWRAKLLDLDGNPIAGKAYSLKNGTITGTLDGSGQTEIVEEPINEAAAANGLGTYVQFPDLRILPDFGKLWRGYPGTDPLPTVTGIGGKIEELFSPALTPGYAGDSQFTNTCVVRTSQAFNAVGPDFIPFVGMHDLESGQGNDGRGHGIPRGNIAVPLKMYGGSDTWPDGRVQAYAFRVSEFAPYMDHYYSDAPKIAGSTSIAPFLNARGVMHFNVTVWNDASGHFDMWDGFLPSIRYSEYFRQSAGTTLWQHVVIRLDTVEVADGLCTATYKFEAR